MNKNRIKVSIIIPVYNVEKYIRKCLDSIQNQTYSNFEVIIINDGSTDNSGDICKEYKSKFKKITIINQVNQGVSHARNQGLIIAKGEYIYFCDPDDYIHPNLLRDNIEMAESHNAQMVVFGFHKIFNDNKVPKSISEKLITNKEEFINSFEDLYKNLDLHVLWNKLYRSDLIKNNNVQFVSQSVGEDAIFNFELYRNVNRIYVNPNIYYNYLIRSNSALGRYQEERFNMNYEELLHLKSLFSYIKVENQFDNLMTFAWYNCLINSLRNLYHNDSRLSKKERLFHLSYIMNKTEISRFLKNINLNEIESKFWIAVLFLCRKNKLRFVDSLFLLKKFIKGR